MTAKEYLSRARGIELNIRSLVNEQQHCKGRGYKEYSALLDERIKELYEIKQETERLIAGIDDHVLQTLLRERYIKFNSWEKVAEAVGYESDYWVRTKLHSRALRAADALLNKPKRAD